ncbi:AMP-binding protein [Amycolatopsis taiwanensis]|uniref:AMP-binding protein n=1 Tax=Amycolatopsis taiwanensis TaxID=342230 RepID=UPI0004BCE189|nr:AMP-binding protein [Amycolatopsis taiwanensis]
MGEASIFLTRMLDVLCDGGDRMAFAHDRRSMTYRAAYEKLRHLHDMLKTEGVTPGRSVAIIGGNVPERILLQIAAQLRGARVVHLESTDVLDDLAPDHVFSADLEGPLLPEHNGSSASEVDIALPRSVETIFPADDGFVSYGETYEQLARESRPDPDHAERVLLIAPISHPVGNRIACKTLLSGDTVVIHENTAEEVLSVPQESESELSRPV